MKPNFIETKKKTRPSLMPETLLNHLFLFQMPITQTNVPIYSQTSLQSLNVNQNQNFSLSELNQAFNYISKGQENINMKCLQHYIEEQGQNPYIGVEMVLLLDQKSKGYVTRQEFIDFFQKNVIASQAQPPQNLLKDKQWIDFIEENSDLLDSFTDINFCKYAAKVVNSKKIPADSTINY